MFYHLNSLMIYTGDCVTYAILCNIMSNMVNIVVFMVAETKTS